MYLPTSPSKTDLHLHREWVGWVGEEKLYGPRVLSSREVPQQIGILEPPLKVIAI
jgi:hypothetical protein